MKDLLITYDEEKFQSPQHPSANLGWGRWTTCKKEAWIRKFTNLKLKIQTHSIYQPPTYFLPRNHNFLGWCSTWAKTCKEQPIEATDCNPSLHKLVSVSPLDRTLALARKFHAQVGFPSWWDPYSKTVVTPGFEIYQGLLEDSIYWLELLPHGTWSVLDGEKMPSGQWLPSLLSTHQLTASCSSVLNWTLYLCSSATAKSLRTGTGAAELINLRWHCPLCTRFIGLSQKNVFQHMPTPCLRFCYRFQARVEWDVVGGTGGAPGFLYASTRRLKSVHQLDDLMSYR